MASNLTLAARLLLDSQRWVQGLTQAQGKTRSFASGVKREFADLRGFMQGTGGMMASIGAGFTVASQVVKSAGLDQSLTRIGQNAGATREQIDGMRTSLMRMAKDTGLEVENLQGGLDVLIAGNLDPDKAVATLGAINKASRITGAGTDTLGKALMVMNTNFKLNLNDGAAVTAMLEKMTVAGRKGFLELESLSDVIPRIAQASKNAGMNDTTMLAFAETLSFAEQDPSRMATLAESTLRMFNNPQYRKKVEKATGVKFVDEKDELRSIELIFTDLQAKYKKLKTGGERQRFAGNVFGEMDITTQTGVMSMLDGGMLGMMAAIKESLGAAGGTFAKDMPAAMDNSVAQAGVLKATLRDAADGFAQPINDAITTAIKFATGKKEEGGLELSGGEMLAGGAGALALAFLGRNLPSKLGRMLGGSASLAGGVAMGTALEKAGAATPVFIVGAAPGVFGGPGTAMLDTATGTVAGGAAARKTTTLAKLATRAAPAAALVASTAGMAVGGSGVLGYGLGSKIHGAVDQTSYGGRMNDALGREIAKALALLGNKGARDALKAEMDVRVYDHRIGVTVRGKDFQNVRSSSTSKPAGTGRRTAGGGR